MKGFQVGVLIFFGVFVFLGVLVFSGAIKLPSKGADSTAALGGSVRIWGTIPERELRTVIAFLNNQNATLKIVYQEKDPRTYEDDLLNAFAFGGMPDMFLMSEDLILTYQDKVLNIPFTYFPERTFTDTYIRAADIFKRGEGFLGFPLLSDPLVMYYNRDLLESAGFTEPPKYWKDLFTYVPRLTQKNEALQVTQSGVALGEFANVNNAKEIFLAMNLQLNNPVFVRNAEGQYDSVFNFPSDVSARPAVQSLNFFNDFSNPIKNIYSWNKSKPSSENAFIAGDLAIYFGRASELETIKNKNPNLNFDVAMLPQVEELRNKVTYADVYALAIPKVSPNAQTALLVAADLANGNNTLAIVGSSGYAPMRRDLISGQKTDQLNTVLYDAALNSRSWIDPDATQTTDIFTRMVESVISGLSTSEDAVDDANNELRRLISR